MNSKEIHDYMMQDKYIREHFLGVFPVNKIPKVIPNSSILIVNQDRSDEEGSHWIVLHYIKNNVVEHFDSLGKRPLKDIHNLLISKYKSYKYNNKRIQNFNTSTCGLFCLYYSFYSARGYKFNEILKDFSENLKKMKT